LEPTVEFTYPMSPVQEGLLYESLRSSQLGEYVEQLNWFMHGPLDLDRFRAAWERAALRLETLRTACSLDKDNMRLARSFVPGRFAGDALYFTATAGRADPESAVRAWRPFVSGRIRDHDVDCTHAHMLRRAPAGEMAPVIADALRTIAPGGKEE
jgi:thioesterase domain-containing protein